MADPFTPEQTAALETLITEKIGPAVNNMFTARLGTVEKKLEKQLQTVTESVTKTLDEKLSSFKPTAQDPDDGGKPGKGGKGKDDPELATLRAKLEALTTQSQQANERASLLRERDRQRNARDLYRGLLSKFGIDGDRFEGAYALLQAQGKIKLSEDVDSDEVFFVGATGDVTPDVGVADWAKSDIAKIYLPPNGTRGSGSRPGSKAPDGKPLTQDQIRANLAAALEHDIGR